MNLAEVAYHSLTESERTEFEQIVQSMVMGGRSSAGGEYPRGTVKTGFGKLTLCSHKEKVGHVFYLLLGLHDRRGRQILEKAAVRQQKRYLTFPSKSVVKSLASNASKKRKLQPTAANDEESTDGDSPRDSTNGESSGAAQSAASKKDANPLPASAFPYRKDLMFGTDHDKTCPFPRDDEHRDGAIEFVCRHLQMHGLGFLLELDTPLDAYQLDQLMTTSWGLLRTVENKHYPSKDAFRTICNDIELIDAIDEDDDTAAADQQDDIAMEPAPSTVEEACKGILPRDLPSRDIQIDEREHQAHQSVQYQRTLAISGCVPKHQRAKPAVKGTGYTGAILSDMSTFTAFVEYLLCFHAWCHYSSDLPLELQEDLELVGFATTMVVQYTDTIIYRGDGSVDTDTCKIHSQLHHALTIGRFGEPMQYNTEVGERGLQEWAKRQARTALKHGRDKFTESTSNRVEETLLLNTALEQARKRATPSVPAEVRNKRIVPHFRYDRNKRGTLAEPNLQSLNRHGNYSLPDANSGYIQPEILKGLHTVEARNSQTFFDIWCEAKLANGQCIRCWPKYRGTNRNQYYDWAMVRFHTDNGHTEYPAKVLALYEDTTNGTMKALVHATDYKTTRNIEGPYGDSRLVKHYRLMFDRRGEPQLFSVPLHDVMTCIVAYEALPYPSPLPPRVASPARQKQHTVMTILPRKEWARLFLTWSKEIQTRQETVLNDEQKNRLDFK